MKDFAGPIATIIAAFAALSVTAYFARHQKKIAKEQADIAGKKLRLDLYDRRFEIFSSIFPFYYAMMSWEGTPEQEEARKRFFRAYQESVFLFTNESGIADLIKKLNDDGGKVIYFKEHGDSYKADRALMAQKFKESRDIQLFFEEGLEELRASMHQYLDFSKV